MILIGAGCIQQNSNTPGPSRFGLSISDPTQDVVLKGNWVRLDPTPFEWGKIEKQKGTYDWAEADQAVKQWDEKGYRILGVISPYALFDQQRCHGLSAGGKMTSICHVDGYERWVKALAERYPQVTHWEIYRDPDADVGNFAYLEYFRLARDQIKSVRSDAVVLHGGVDGFSEEERRFWQPIWRDEKASSDIATLLARTSSNDFFARDYRQFLNMYGFFKTPFWVTHGWVSNESVNEDARSRLTFINSVEAFANGAEMIFASDDTPVFFQNLLYETLDRFHTVEKLNSHTVRFDFPNGSVYALWDEDVLPESLKGTVSVLRYDGTKKRLRAQDVKGDPPMFVFTK